MAPARRTLCRQSTTKKDTLHISISFTVLYTNSFLSRIIYKSFICKLLQANTRVFDGWNIDQPTWADAWAGENRTELPSIVLSIHPRSKSNKVFVGNTRPLALLSVCCQYPGQRRGCALLRQSRSGDGRRGLWRRRPAARVPLGPQHRRPTQLLCLVSEGAEVIQLHIEGSLTIPTSGIKRV